MELAMLIVGLVADVAPLAVEAITASKERRAQLAKEFTQVMTECRTKVEALADALLGNNADADAALKAKFPDEDTAPGKPSAIAETVTEQIPALEPEPAIAPGAEVPPGTDVEPC